LAENSKTFDLFNGITGEAISAKTLNTLSMYYIKYPQKIYGKMIGYIEDAVQYRPYRKTDVDPAKIQSKTIHLGIPEYTSPVQWRYLYATIIYGKERGVRIVITRIRE
jgi:hypothetical protein